MCTFTLYYTGLGPDDDDDAEDDIEENAEDALDNPLSNLQSRYEEEKEALLHRLHGILKYLMIINIHFITYYA